ncbi:MAG TPA: anti-sigma factor antagonist, partial [Actinoplanes sp.]|nr:anti-sigma factor antagonist [Actinoplanes sp.]
RVAGEIDLDTADVVRHAVLAAVEAGGVVDVVVDLAGVSFCDSSGIAVLDEGYGLAVQRGIRFRVVDPQPVVRRVLDIACLLDIVSPS